MKIPFLLRLAAAALVADVVALSSVEAVGAAWSLATRGRKAARSMSAAVLLALLSPLSVFAAAPETAKFAGASRDFVATTRYLNLPIKNGAPVRRVTLLVDGKVEVVNNIELANGPPDWWAVMEVSPWRGRTLTLRVDELPADSRALDAIEPGDAIKESGDLYREALRPQLHFSARRGWINDPNGLVFFRGEYHLFFQHNPYGTRSDNKHWGHATSRDLVHWQEHGDVLSPDALGAMFSGSAVVDWNNTSGLGEKGRPPLVLAYTAYGREATQCLASSLDGRSFAKFPGNPVVPMLVPKNRDPKVIWHAPSRRWVMVVYAGIPVGGGVTNSAGRPALRHIVQFLTSPDLRQWTPTSSIEGASGDDRFLLECPDFFELPVEGGAGGAKWVLTGANNEYLIGQFDGATFIPESSRLNGTYGNRTFYAGQTFSDVPNGRRIQIGFGRIRLPGMPFTQMMLLPCDLRLLLTESGVRLARMPVPELAALRDGPDQGRSPAAFRGELVELRAEVAPEKSVEFTVRGAKIQWDASTQAIVVNGVRVPAPLVEGRQRIVVFVDRAVIEIFASDGLTYLPLAFTPRDEDHSVSVGEPAGLRSLKLYKLKSMWGNAGSP